MRIGSLFSGIGGLELGLEWAGVGHTVWQVEREPFCQRVLAKHWPDAQRFDDVTKVGAHNLPPVEVICGGFPCQDISYAGKGAGLAGERSGLWFEFARIVRELRPRFVVVENVSALLSRGLDAVLGTLASLGYDAEWSCVRASDVGARHRRERVFVIAWRVDDADSRGLRRGEAPGEGGHAALADQGLDDADDARLEGRGVRGQRRADERLVGSAGGENMANAGRRSLQRRRGSGFVDGASRAGEGDTPERQRDGDAAGGGGEAAGCVADAAVIGSRRVANVAAGNDADGDGTEWQEASGRSSARGKDMAHSNGGLLDGERAGRGNDAHGRGRARDLGGEGDREQVDQGPQAKSGVGLSVNGVRPRLDVARPGEPQHAWEAPRVVTQAQDRAARLKALGNAVVPQVAELVGRRLMEIAKEIES